MIQPLIASDLAYEGHNKNAISVRQLNKAYRLYANPPERLKDLLFSRFGRHYGREFWALRDISFDVRHGESIGIIGRNGSGKSTLLQVIAGVLTATSGTVQVSGRVATLLELGSGFNPEYTGRENVFVSGSILGLSQAEMNACFDQIVSFADIGGFIDQPVRTYSSGMFARLAFSVAVSVNPDILLVDEILAVGDYGFQQKCIARLRQMRENGLTLLFVSHSPDVIKSVCQKAIFLINGKLEYWGQAEEAVNLYLKHIRQQANQDLLEAETELGRAIQFQTNVRGLMRYGTGQVQLQKVELTDENGQACRAFRFGDFISLHIYFESHIEVAHLSVSFLVRDGTGIDLLGTTTFDEKYYLPFYRRGAQGHVCFRFQSCLQAGNFGISVALNRVSQPDYSDNILFDQVDGCVSFTVIPTLERPVHYKFYCPISVVVNEETL